MTISGILKSEWLVFICDGHDAHSRRIVALLLVMTITISFSAMAESGINEEPNLSGTDLESVFFP